jgi:hypothetical protein
MGFITRVEKVLPSDLTTLAIRTPVRRATIVQAIQRLLVRKATTKTFMARPLSRLVLKPQLAITQTLKHRSATLTLLVPLVCTAWLALQAPSGTPFRKVKLAMLFCAQKEPLSPFLEDDH